ncbi:MAG: hypothetical protein CXZ00_07635 [Acidobacteria bacterium]|nr:MAG: hypothetical protein CXZ00_07635 [Acidobacteriota bacterium]
MWCISRLGSLLISVIGRTLRFESSSEPGGVQEGKEPPQVVIGSFWHRCVIPATWFFRDRGVAVMTSRSYDGEYIARIIEHFGFVAVRGSSSRGGSIALLGMQRVLASGHTAAFTIDGPRGPRFVAKPGPVMLARMSGAPILCFYLAAERPWILNSWDALMIPRPFSRVHVRWTTLIHVPKDANDEQMSDFHRRIQDALERARRDAVNAIGPGAS